MIDKLLKNSIDFQLITNIEDFISLRDEWNDVLLKSGIQNAFLRHEWLCSWWKSYGKDKELMILKFSRDGQTIGFIPLMKYTTVLTGLKLKAIGFLTNHWTRMNFILASHTDECLESLAAYIKESKEIFILAQMHREHEIYKKLGCILKEQHISFAEQEKPHAYVDLKGTWEDYFNSQSRNFRMDSRRKLKRFEKEGAVRLARSKGEDADKVLLQLKAIAQNCWQAKDNVNIISTSEGFHFYQDICETTLKGSMLDFTVLTVDDKPVAYMVGLIQHDCYFAFDTAYDKNFEEFSPGLILHNLLMEELYKDKVRIFDFGFDASYKKRWSSQTLITSDVVIFPRGIKSLVWRMGQQLKNLRKLIKSKEPKND